MVGGEKWGEVVDGPVGDAPWSAARWRKVQTCQFAAALVRGELWAEDGSRLAGHVPVAVMGEVCTVGPQDRRIRGSLGVFDGHHGHSSQAQFPAIWSLDSRVHSRMNADPNAWLTPQPGRDHKGIWSQAGMLHISPSVRYTSQPIHAVRTRFTTLGVNTWFTLRVQDDDPILTARREVALALWFNSTLGLLLQANHANRVQQGRGIGRKGMLKTLTTLDVRRLETWQLDEAQTIWRDFDGRQFQPFYRCVVDSARIELDERVVRNVLGLGEDAVTAVATLRTLLADDPSIYGSKTPALPP